MKKLKKLVLATGLLLTATFGLSTIQSHAATTNYQVKSGDTLWKISCKYGVSIELLKSSNHRSNDKIYPGEKLMIPNSTISDSDKDLIAHLVHAEAKGESYAGKVAVATVILNRVASPSFPNTVKGVIYQKTKGHYAFTPVQNKSINQVPDADSKEAVNEAIALKGKGKGSLFFYNPKTAVSKWIYSRPVTLTIGNHRFAK